VTVRRKRQQTGTIFNARSFWYVRYFEDRVEGGEVKHARIAKQVGPVTTRGKRPPFTIEEQAKAIVEDANVTNKTPERVLTVSDFVERVYFPHMEQFKRASTQKGYRDIWNIHLKPRSGSQWLKDVRTFDVQSWLDSMAKPGTLGRNTLRHIKTFISAVFKLARQQGYYLNENPVRDTGISPKAPQPQETYAYSLDEIQSMLALIPERAAAVFAVAVFAGLRKARYRGCSGRTTKTAHSVLPAPSGKVTSMTPRRNGAKAPYPSSSNLRRGSICTVCAAAIRRVGRCSPAQSARRKT
jgi:hypothetical protein